MTFKPGQSGNKSGRPRGVSDKRTRLRELLEPHAEALTAKAVELALAGDVNALRLCFERLIPKIRHETVNINLPNIAVTSNTHTLLEVGKATLQAVIQGKISPEQGKNITMMLEQNYHLIEVTELEERLKKLEDSFCKSQ